MRVLVISSTTWSDNNSFGNSFSNIFDGIPNLQFANIYCKPGMPCNMFDIKYYQITEKSLIANLIDPSKPSGKAVSVEVGNIQKVALPGYERARKLRWQVLLMMRDFIWKIGRWKSDALCRFLDEFQPDIIFQPVYYSSYIGEIAIFAQEYTGVPMVGYISDDNYTMKKICFSPLFWIDRMYKRKKVKSLIERCKILYVISDIQKREYEKIFTPPCKILTKVGAFTNVPEDKRISDNILMIYAGNLGNGRAVSLRYICSAVAQLRSDGQKIALEIFTNTPLDKRSTTLLNCDGCTLHPPIPYKELLDRQKDSDILVHVEGLSLKDRLDTHQSFSTKLVDYFMLGKCIFAVGKQDQASIDYLINNDAAVVASTKKEVYTKLRDLVKDSQKINQYAEKAFLCGKKNHEKGRTQQMLIKDFERLIGT